jgi:phage terminase large subunit GpA-like protein
VLMITGSNSAAGLRSMPIKFLFADEVDAYPSDVDGEGDPLSLAERRTITFPRRKIFICSTPTIAGQSRIEREFNLTDQRRYFVPCPHCGGTQHLRWAQMVWTDNDPTTARYRCEHCDTLIPEHHKTAMLESGRWLPTAHGSTALTVGYHLNSLYSPLGWKSWADIVAEFLRCKNDPPSLKTWVNTILGETFEDDYAAALGAEGLAERAEFYDPDIVPDGAVIVTVGVDVQDNRLAIVMVAWGIGEEAWVLQHCEIYGDPSAAQLWRQLDDVVLSPLTWRNGHKRVPDVIAIDSGGHYTHEAYQYARERKKHNVVAIKGASQRDKPPIGKGARVDVNIRGQLIKRGGMVYSVGTNAIKSTIYGRLAHNSPGAGYIHTHSKLTPEFYQQLTSEKKRIRYVRGHPVYEWTKQSSARNEVLDCMVYAYAALNLLYQRYNKKTIFQQFATTCATVATGAVVAIATNTAATPARRTRTPPKRDTSFITNW